MLRMRVLPFLVLIGLIVTACGGSSRTLKAKPTARATSNTLVRVGTVPVPTLKPGQRHKMRQAPRGTPSKTVVVPTAKPLATATPIPATAFTAALYGKVLDAKSGHGLADALVVAGSNPKRITHTSASGSYRIQYPGAIAVPVTVTKKGYAGQVAMGKIKKHGTFRLNFKLPRLSAHKPVAPPPPLIFGSR